MANKRMDEILKGVWKSFTDEQKEKVKQCRTTDELMKFAADEGIELPDEILDAASGGVQAGSILGGGKGEFTGYDDWKNKKGC